MKKKLNVNRSHRARALAALTVVVLALSATACGGSSDGGSSAAGNGTDLAFVSDMVPHHKSAVEMATIAQKRGQSTFVKKLADDIMRTQKQEITVMSAAKGDLTKAEVKKAPLGVPSAMMGMDMNTASLKTATPFDKAFIDMMVPHHQGAIRMARVEMSKGKSEKLMKLSKDIVAAQTREIKAMNAHRTEAFGSPSPAGGVPAAKESGGSMGGMKGMKH